MPDLAMSSLYWAPRRHLAIPTGTCRYTPVAGWYACSVATVLVIIVAGLNSVSGSSHYVEDIQPGIYYIFEGCRPRSSFQHVKQALKSHLTRMCKVAKGMWYAMGARQQWAGSAVALKYKY